MAWRQISLKYLLIGGLDVCPTMTRRGRHRLCPNCLSINSSYLQPTLITSPGTNDEFSTVQKIVFWRPSANVRNVSESDWREISDRVPVFSAAVVKTAVVEGGNLCGRKFRGS